MVALDRGKLSASISRLKALAAIAIVETFFIGAIYTWTLNVTFKFPINKNFEPKEKLWIYGLVYAFVMICGNSFILGPARRFEYYKRIFDGWHRQRRTMWRIYLVVIAVLGFSLFVAAVHASR